MTTPVPQKQTPVPQKQLTPVPQKQLTTPVPQKQQTTPVPQKQQTTPVPQKQQTTPVPQKQQTTPVPQKQQTTPVPQKQQNTPVPQKQQTTPVPQKQLTPVPQKQTPVPQKQQTTPVPQKQQTTPVPQKQLTPVPQKQTPVPQKQQTLICSGIPYEGMLVVKRFCKEFGFKFSSKFSRDTSHVIVMPKHSDKPRVCERTLKYFQCITNRSWVVTFAWIEASLREQSLVPSEPYEIEGDTVNGDKHDGPRRARTGNASLLTGFEICCYGKFVGLSADDLNEMIELCGGRVVKSPDYFQLTTTNSGKRLMIMEPNIKIEKQTRALIIKLQTDHRVIVLSREWILDSISKYELCKFDQNYRIQKSKSDQSSL
ncbi:breast cancer type 1 susceptibility protein homolog [Tubulanus polymorphus]|uniref:breast cancer type 1 susceptibility protein homolog n=1 Tax=Tubulanus polymorphus TaxID=672921 RepID=UPI003DA5059D